MSTPVGYSGTPLPKKLGIRAGGRMLVVDAPAGFVLAPLPDGVMLHHAVGSGGVGDDSAAAPGADPPTNPPAAGPPAAGPPGDDPPAAGPPAAGPPGDGTGAEPYDVILAFCPDLATLDGRFAALSARIGPRGALWIGWPKRSSGVPTDLTENVVREVGLRGGLVDVKVAAVDATWSGLKFVYRLADRPR